MSKKNSLKFLESLSSGTIKNYMSTIHEYENFHGLNIDELIAEAIEEQTNNVAPHMLSVIDRIESFQDYLINKGMVYGTIVVMIGRIKTIYTKNRIILPYITPINPKTTKRREYIEYKDILTKEELRCALSHMRLPARARAMVMIQGGLSNAECESLTLDSFLEETFQYHQCHDPIQALKWLADENHPIIWVTKLVREKTKKPYYALIGAEAVNTIAEAKLYEVGLKKNKGILPNKLLNVHIASFGRTCREVSKRCGFPLVAEESKVRPHNLRRFHATYIKGGVLSYEENTLTNMQIDELQGRGKTSVQDTYIKSNPLHQKLLYAKVINNISLYHEYEYEILGEDVVLHLVDPLEKNKELKNQVDDLNKKLQEKKVASERVQKLRDELGEDTFKELIGEILNAS